MLGSPLSVSSLRAGGRSAQMGGGFPSPRYILCLLSSAPDLAAFSPPTTSCCHLECWEAGELEGRLGWGLKGGGPELDPSEGRRKRRCWHPGQRVGPGGQPPLLTLSAALPKTAATSYFRFRRKQKLRYEKINIKYLNNV